MSERKTIAEMNADELRVELERLRYDLKDLEDTFSFNLAYTPAHHPAGVVEAHEEEMEEMRERISMVEARLREVSG